jgi:urease accessory protein
LRGHPSCPGLTTQADGKLLFADVVRFVPGEWGASSSMGILGAYDVVATIYVLTRLHASSGLVDLLRRALSADSDVLAGVSELPNDCGVAVRMLGPTSTAVRAALWNVWDTTRRALLSAPAPDLRKGSTLRSTPTETPLSTIANGGLRTPL